VAAAPQGTQLRANERPGERQAHWMGERRVLKIGHHGPNIEVVGLEQFGPLSNFGA
jgi:hypothetical protein